MKIVVAITALAGGVAGCMPVTPHYLVAASDPAIRGRGARYATVTAGVKDYRPVGPRDWRALNREVGPADDRQDRGQDSAAGARRGR